MKNLLATHRLHKVFLLVFIIALNNTSFAQTYNYGTGVITGNNTPFGAGGSGVVVTGSGNNTTVTVSGTVNISAGTYNFANLVILSGSTMTATGDGPLIILCTGTATVNGSIIANGGIGLSAVNGGGAANGGTGGAGGWGGSGGNGGNGGATTNNSATAGSPFLAIGGNGAGGAGAGTSSSGGTGGAGGGAGYGVSGATGSTGTGSGGNGGATYGTSTLTTSLTENSITTTLIGGSGGGGGGFANNSTTSTKYGSGGGGGGGGGAIQLSAFEITFGSSGFISAKGGGGGNGFAGSKGVGGGGGGGSGGSILLQYASSNYTSANASVAGGPGGTATGGETGGTGGAGILLIQVDYCSTNNWQGGTSGYLTDWFMAANWSCGFVPTSTTNVEIPGSLSNYPDITANASEIAYAQNLQIDVGASLTIDPVNVELDISGNFTDNGMVSLGSGTLKTIATGGAQTITGNIVVGNFLVNNSDGVTISSGEGNSLSVSGTLTLAAGILTTNNNLTITSNSSGAGLIDDFSGENGGAISGNLTVQRYAVNPDNGYYYLGTPVGANSNALSQWAGEFAVTGYNGATDGSQVVPSNCTYPAPATLASNSPYGTLYDYIESSVTTCYMQGWHVRLSGGTINTAQGFAAIVPNGTLLSLNGTFNTGTITTSLSDQSTVAHAAGYNLVSNPYTSPIDWLQVASDAGPNSNVIVNGTAQLYESQGEYANSYQPVNLSTETSTLIGSSQAFFIQAASDGATLTFNNSMRSNEGANSLLRTAPVYDQKLTMNVTGNGYADVTNILFGSNFTDTLDYGYDAFKMMNSVGHPSLFVTDTANNYSIYAIPSVTETERDIPVSLVPGANGNFSFIVNLDNFDPIDSVFLEDMQLHTIQNLVTNSTYNFSANTSDAPARFMLHFILADTTAGINNVQAATATITGYATNVNIAFNHFTTTDEVTVNIYDLTGRKIIPPQNISTGNNRHVINLSDDIVTGYYFVVLTGQNYEKAQKVFLTNTH